MECLFFFIGLLLGGVIGVVAMCLFQINRMNGKDRIKVRNFCKHFGKHY